MIDPLLLKPTIPPALQRWDVSLLFLMEFESRL